MKVKRSPRSKVGSKVKRAVAPYLSKFEYDFSKIKTEDWEVACEYEINREAFRYRFNQNGFRKEEYFKLPLEVSALMLPPWRRLPESQREFLRTSSNDLPAPGDPDTRPLKVWSQDMAFMSEQKRKTLDQLLSHHKSYRSLHAQDRPNSVLAVIEINLAADVSEIEMEFKSLVRDLKKSRYYFKKNQRNWRSDKYKQIFLDLSLFRLRKAGFMEKQCVEISEWMKSPKIPGSRPRLNVKVVNNAVRRTKTILTNHPHFSIQPERFNDNIQH